MGPDDFQYNAQDQRQTFMDSIFGRGISAVTGGVTSFTDTLKNLDAAQPNGGSGFTYSPPSTSAARSPTNFTLSNNATTTTVDVDGGTSFFGQLADAAKSTLLTNLDGIVAGFGNNNTSAAPQVQQASYGMPATVAGFPIGGVIAVGVVGGFLVWKYG
jgi:hypothetical protein